MKSQNKSLQKKIAIGAVWMTFLRVTYRLIGLISTVILARLLTPDDFGVAAIAMSIFALINTFSQFGFETVLIQHKSPSKSHYNTAWTFNLVFGVLAAILLASSSSFVGEFYENKDLASVTIVISILFLLHGSRNVGVVDFQKNLTFDKEFRLQIIPKFISFFVTLALAIIYKNFWALVIGNVVWKAMEVANSYIMHPFRPRISFREGKELFGFSKWLMVNNFLTFMNNKTPELTLGKLVSPHAAAIYNLAAEIGKMSTSEVIANLNRAIYPGYAKVSADLDKLRALYKDSIRVIAFIAMPVGTGVALVSSYIVILMLGQQWLDAIEPVFYLALAGAINSLKSNGNYVYFSLGKPRIATFELIIRTCIFIATLIYFINIEGVIGAAKAFFITSIVMFFVSNIILKYVLQLGLSEQIGLYVTPFLSTIIMATCVQSYFEFFLVDIFMIDFILAILIGVVSYIVSIYIIWIIAGRKSGVEKQVISFIRSKI